MAERYDGRDSTSNDPPAFPSTSTTKVNHPEFYFDSVYVIFEVENVRFRVSSRLLLNESPKFGKLFGLTKQANGIGDVGSGDRGPIVMPDDIKSADFLCLLKVLYPTSALIEPVKLSKVEWISILHLSTLWKFLSLRSTAITQLSALLSPLSPLEKIMLGRRFFVSSWVFSGYDTLGDRLKAISDEEGAEMGLHTSLKLFRIRESRIRHDAQPQPQSIFGGTIQPSPAAQRISIEDSFKDELTAIRVKESEFKAITNEMPTPIAASNILLQDGVWGSFGAPMAAKGKKKSKQRARK